MRPVRQTMIRFCARPGLLFTLFLGLLAPLVSPSVAFGQATHFTFVTVPSTGVTYGVGSTVAFTLEAQDLGGTRDNLYNGTVTFSLVDSVSGLPSDPAAIIVGNGGVTQAGSGLNFASGTINLTVTFKAGSDGEQLKVTSASLPTTLTPPSAPFYKVKGSSDTYYTKDTNGDLTPENYSGLGNSDLLIAPPPTGLTSTFNKAVTIPNTSNIVGSAAYTITGINGGYAYGGAQVVPNLLFKIQTSADNPTVTARVILVYDGSNPLLNYDAPRSSFDTVYEGTVTNLDTSLFQPMNTMSYLSGPAFQPFMQNGMIILRVWSDASAGNMVTMRYSTSSASAANISSILVPYSSANTLPVKGTISPSVVPDNAVTNLKYVIKNQYSSGVTSVSIEIPNSPAPISQYWGVQNAISCSPATVGSAVVASQASASGPGSIVFSAPTTLAANASVTLTIPVTVTDSSASYQFKILDAITETSVLAPKDSSAAFIQTLGTPPIPGSFAATAINFNSGGGAVSLSWGTVTAENSLGYVLDRAPGSGSFPMTLVGTGSTNFTDNTVTNLTGYTYQVASYNTIAQSGNASAGPVTAYANPGAPVSVVAKTGGTTIQLNWSAPVSVSGSYPLAGYQIYRGTSPGGELASPLTQLGLVTTFNDTAVSGGTTYYYEITAIDNKYTSGSPLGPHNSDYSAEVSGLPPGNPPTGLVSTLKPPPSAAITLTWAAPVSQNVLNGTITNYRIYRATAPGAPVSWASSGGPTTYVDNTSLVQGASYIYYVTAVDGLGIESYPSASVTQSVGPSAPVSFAASPSNAAGITFTWAANPLAESVTNYLVERTSPGPVTTAAGNAVSLLVNAGLAQGTDYIYVLAAVDSFGVTGPLSNPVTTALLPNIPASFSVTANGAVRSNIDMAWTAPAGGTNVTGYNLYRNTLNSFPGLAGAVTTGLAALAYQDTSLSSANAGTTYFYFLQAQNKGGAGTAVTVKGQQIPPNPPAGLASSPSSTGVTLTWTARPGAENVSTYILYRGSTPAPSSALVTVGGTSYTDLTASAGVSYYYRVTATNPGGGGAPGGESLSGADLLTGKLPQTPTGLGVSVNTSNIITFNWGAITDANASSVSIWVNGSPVTGVATSPTTFVEPSPRTANTSFNYTLSVNNPFGASVTATAVTVLTYPAAPTFNSLGLVSGGVSQVFDWTLAGGLVTSYNVYRSQNIGGPYFKVLGVPASGLTMPTTQGLAAAPGQVYYYKVTALNPTGEGPDSNILSLNIPPGVPAPVTVVSGVSAAVTQVDLSWPPVTGQGVTSYKIYRATTNSIPSYSFVNSTGGTSYSDSGSLLGNTLYYYLVTSDNGMESVLQTSDAISVTAYSPPNPPASLAVTAGTGQVSLSWSAAGVTNTYPVVGYNVYESTSAGVTGLRVNATPVPGTNFTVPSLTNGTAYYFSLQTVDNATHTSAVTGQVSEIPVSSPGVPGGVTQDNGDRAIQITWTGSSAGTLPIGGYILRRVDLSGPTTSFISVGASPTGYVDVGLTNGTSYAYSVRAQDSSGVTTGTHVSAFSAPVTGVPGSFVNPPGNVTGTGGNGQAAVTWTDSFTGLGGPVSFYQLFRSTSPTGTYTQAGPDFPYGTTNYSDSPLVNGTAYYYYLIAIATGPVTSAHSVTIRVTPAPPPLAPGSPAVLDGSNQATLSWTAPAPTGAVTMKQYVIYQAVPPGSAAVSIAVTSNSATSYIDSVAAVNGTPAEYKISAINSNNVEGALSSPVTAYPYAMGAPTGLVGSSSASAVTLNWSPPSSSFPVTGYQVLRSTTSGVYGAPLTTVASAAVTDTTATLGLLYYYEIKAIDDKGHVSAASTEIADGASNPPSAPSTFIVSGGDSQILLDWSPVTVPAAGSFPVSYYLVTGVGGGPVTLPVTQTSYLDIPVANGGAPTTYTVQAVDATGQLVPNVHLSAAVTASATASGLIVNPPTGLTAVASGPTSIYLSWTPSNDQGRVIDFYTLQRSTSFGSGYGSPVTILNPSSGAVVSYEVTGLSPNQTYYFVMKAHDGGSGTLSANSNHAWAKTPNGPAAVVGQMTFDANLLLPLTAQTLGITYMVPNDGNVDLFVYDVSGHIIQTINAGAAVANVQGNSSWDGKDKNGNVVASGLYLIEIKAVGFHQVKKVAVVK